MIPLKQTIYIVKAGQEDEWGIPQPGQEIAVKGRIDFEVKKVTNAEGAEVVSSGTVLLKGAQDIDLNDQIKWVDPLGKEHVRRPIQVNPLTDLSGKVLFTQVII